MIKILKGIVLITLALASFQNLYAQEKYKEDNFEIIEFKPETGFPYKATLFPANSKHIVLLFPGGAFSMESWYGLAGKFQQKGIAAISVGARSYNNVKSTLKYLRDKKYEKFSVIGASLGGGSVTDVLSKEDTQGIIKLVALAPYGGSSINNQKIDKLFIVANKDSFGIYNSVLKLFQDSSNPKYFYKIDSKKHAQHLFTTEHKDAIEKRIIEFVMDVK
ncbi:MAG: hypothetical protein D6B28_07785 [Gammaproteobacteria bacterium]|nr:MAG: hypothetical protein D6B28_07785 [Gammaproteobacteria bacterium]